MNYLLTGEEQYLLNRKIKEIEKDLGINEMNKIVYNATSHDAQTILSDCNTLPFFSENKLVIVEQCKFLSATPTEFDTDALISYLKQPLESTTLILVLGSKQDDRRKVVKEIKKLCKSFVFSTLNEFERNNFVNQQIKKYAIQIDKQALSVFHQRCGFDLNAIVQELRKLVTYQQMVSVEVVEQLVTKPVEDNVFLLSQAIIEQNIKHCFIYVNDFKKVNIEVIALIAMLATQFRFLAQVKTLSNMRMGKQEIARELHAHPYRVEKTLEQVYRRDLSQIQKILNELANLDQKIKLGLVDKNLGFETFLIKYCA